MKIVAIDPGTKKSAYVIYSNNLVHTPHKNGGYIVDSPGWTIRDKGKVDNEDMIYILKDQRRVDRYVIEDMQGGKGRIFGKTTIDTIKWIGRFQQIIEDVGVVDFVYRKPVEHYILKDLEKPHPFSTVDSNIRHVLIKRFGDITEGLTNDMWQAFALAVYFVEVRLGVEL